MTLLLTSISPSSGENQNNSWERKYTGKLPFSLPFSTLDVDVNCSELKSYSYSEHLFIVTVEALPSISWATVCTWFHALLLDWLIFRLNALFVGSFRCQLLLKQGTLSSCNYLGSSTFVLSGTRCLGYSRLLVLFLFLGRGTSTGYCISNWWSGWRQQTWKKSCLEIYKGQLGRTI